MLSVSPGHVEGIERRSPTHAAAIGKSDVLRKAGCAVDIAGRPGT